MITRFALFKESIKPGQTDAFRAAVLERLGPLWTRFPGNTDVHVMFSDDQDEGAPEFPLILAATHSGKAVMDAALDSPFRAQSRDATGEIVAEHFEGRIHHHVTQLNTFKA